MSHNSHKFRFHFWTTSTNFFQCNILLISPPSHFRRICQEQQESRVTSVSPGKARCVIAGASTSSAPRLHFFFNSKIPLKNSINNLNQIKSRHAKSQLSNCFFFDGLSAEKGNFRKKNVKMLQLCESIAHFYFSMKLLERLVHRWSHLIKPFTFSYARSRLKA